MKNYTVKEISELLNTNPETVRRWIRDKKLDATIESKKGGHIVCEAALQEFLKSTPKYASVASTFASSVNEAAMLPTMIVGGLIAQKIIDVEQLENNKISSDDVINFLRREIKKRTDAIEAKENTIVQLQKQIDTDRLQIREFQKLMDNFSNPGNK